MFLSGPCESLTGLEAKVKAALLRRSFHVRYCIQSGVGSGYPGPIDRTDKLQRHQSKQHFPSVREPRHLEAIARVLRLPPWWPKPYPRSPADTTPSHPAGAIANGTYDLEGRLGEDGRSLIWTDRPPIPKSHDSLNPGPGVFLRLPGSC